MNDSNTIIVSDRARKDLHNIVKNLTSISKNYYFKFYKKFLDKIFSIKFF